MTMTKKLAQNLIISFLVIFGIIATCLTIITLNTPPDDPIVTSDDTDEPAPNSPIPEPSDERFDYSWAEHPYIAHALGAVDGHPYTNSREAYTESYSLGHRVFEADFAYTTDNKLVLCHDVDAWHEQTSRNLPFSSSNFSSLPLYNEYHTYTARDLLDLLSFNDQTYLITDTKSFDEETTTKVLTDLVTYAQQLNPEILDRIVIQIYSEPMLDWAMSVYPWKSVIYTLYANPDWTPENVLAFAERTGVKFITLWHYSLTEEIADLWLSAGLQIGVHTVNDMATATTLRNMGASVIYTDTLNPKNNPL